MEILKGAEVANALNQTLREALPVFGENLPHLAIIRVGQRPDDMSYERGAVKRMAAVGLRCSCFSFEEEISNSEFQQRFDEINEDEDVDGILLLRPLPRHLDERAIEQRIDPAKDVDGISPVNLAKVFAGDPSGYAPCTPEAVIEMLDYAKIDLTGKRAVVVGRSLVVGKPLAMLLMGRNATVTICHTKTVELPAVCRSAQVLVAAAGRARMLDGRYVGPDAVVVDVGINVDQSGSLCGDVDFGSLPEHTALATPVPGGVGTVTTSVLAKHVVQAAARRRLSFEKQKEWKL